MIANIVLEPMRRLQGLSAQIGNEENDPIISVVWVT